ncbi:Major_facilitator superfamily protein [Hexamita inflata]|uniref:Major facilitator superfamily protein n=1 Tax=Hexamita inflata TaxID=28002 RepID=A0AA86TX49_9EUKA|nr:Major facilitator superfamily protein [Hexamita inflata]
MSSSHNEVKESSQLDSEIQIQMPQLTITNMTKQKRCKAQSLLPGQAKFVSMMPLLFLSGITCFIDTQATNMALPYMQKDFKISEPLVQWSLTIYYLAQASLSIPLAKLGENIGQVNILLILFILSTGLNIALFFVKNFPAFLVLRFLSGAVCGGQLVCRTSLVRKLAPPEKAQAYIQYLQILLSIMVIIVPLLAGILIDIQWRWVYIACAASAFLNIFTLIPYTNPETPKEKAKFDIWGCIVLFFAIGFLDLAFTILSTYHYLGCGILVVLSAIFFAIFIFVEKRASDPVLPLQLMKNPQYVTLCVWSVLIKIILILELLQILIIINQKYYISCISTYIQIYIKFQTQNKKQLQARDSFIQKKQTLPDTTTIALSTCNTQNSNDYKHKLKFHYFFKFTTIPICQRRVRLLLYGRFMSHIALLQTFNKILCIISIIITDLAFIILGMKIVLGHNKILCC